MFGEEGCDGRVAGDGLGGGQGEGEFLDVVVDHDGGLEGQGGETGPGHFGEGVLGVGGEWFGVGGILGAVEVDTGVGSGTSGGDETSGTQRCAR